MIFNFNAAEVFQVAVQIEENGRRFYQEGLKHIDDPEVKRLFEELAREEVEHKKKFESILAELPKEATSPNVFDPENQKSQYIQMMADQHVFVKAEGMDRHLADVRDMKDALKLAIEFEKDSVIFFLSMQDATEGTRGKELINLLIREEQEHLRRLSAELHRVTRK
jgi:rubrerythrin